jgi:hypothetical protein
LLSGAAGGAVGGLASAFILMWFIST